MSRVHSKSVSVMLFGWLAYYAKKYVIYAEIHSHI